MGLGLGFTLGAWWAWVEVLLAACWWLTCFDGLVRSCRLYAHVGNLLEYQQIGVRKVKRPGVFVRNGGGASDGFRMLVQAFLVYVRLRMGLKCAHRTFQVSCMV
jgi:hypothetical protein